MTSLLVLAAAAKLAGIAAATRVDLGVLVAPTTISGIGRLASALAVVLSVPLAFGAALPSASLAARWWAGFLLAGVPLVLLHGIGMPQSASLALVMAAAAAVVWIQARRGQPLLADVRGREPSWPLPLVVTLLVVAAALHTFTQPAEHWDAVAVWWPKARALQVWVPLGELTRPTYPDLGAMAWAMAALAASGLEPAGRIVFPVAAILGLLALGDLAPKASGVRTRLGITAVAVLFYGSIEFTNGYQDALLGAAAGVAVIALSAGLSREDHSSDVWRGCLTAGALGMLKSEGLILGTGILASWVAVQLFADGQASRHERLTRLAAPVFGFIAVAAIWPMLLLTHGLNALERQEGTFTLAGVLAVPSRLGERLPVIGGFLWSLAFEPRRRLISLAGALLLCVGVPLVLRRLTASSRQRLAFYTLVGTWHAAFIVVVFLATEAPLLWHLDTALLRLLMQLRFVVAAALVIVLVDVLEPRADAVSLPPSV